MKKLILTSLIIILSNALAWSQDESDIFPPPEQPTEISVSKSKGKITVDGMINEQSWESAEVVDDFFRREPRQGGEVKYKTEVRFLYDDKNLYVSAICEDSLGLQGIRIQDLRRDFRLGGNDAFGVSLDPQNLKLYAQGFQTTPYGNQRDFQEFNGTNTDIGWNTLWKVRTKRNSDGYVVEMEIPFKSLRYDLPEEGNTIEIGMTLIRYSRRDLEISSFPAIPQMFSPSRMIYSAKLVGIEVPPPSANLRIDPYVLYQYEQIKNGASLTDKDSDPKAGFDVKWAINPKTVLDLTVNTDFAQADVDRAVNNLERFNVLFPERRQFFLENSGIWAGAEQRSIRPFFSRRIGLQSEFNSAPAPVEFGGRFTQRSTENTIAGLFVRQSETENSAAANFGVFRYLKNFGKENNVGLMLTHRLDESTANLNLSQNNNTTATVDGQFRPTSAWDIQYMLSSSFDNENSNTGFAGRLFVSHLTNKHWLRWSTEYIDAKYNPGIGFVKQNDLIEHNARGYYIWRPKRIEWIRRWDPGVYINYNHDATKLDSFQQSSIYIFPIYVWFQNNSFFEFSFTPTWQNINFDFSPLGLEIEQDRYNYTRYYLEYRTDQSRKLSGYLIYNFGKFYNGTRNTLTARARYNPLPNISLTADYEQNNLNDIGLTQQDLTTDLYSISMRLALNPRLQLSSFYQYNSFNDQGRWNLRLSWEYMPLSFVYLVFNDTQNDAFDPNQTNTQFISKITFLKQF